MTQQRTFDLKAGEKAKAIGLASAARRRALILKRARAYAQVHALIGGKVSADDVYQYLERRGLNPQDLGNAAGNLFRGKQWVFTGEWVKSKRASNHARMIRVWALREGE